MHKLQFNLEDIVSEDECNFIKETIDSKSIPTPKSLIKDHKDLNEDEDFPTRIVIPATNFTAISKTRIHWNQEIF